MAWQYETFSLFDIYNKLTLQTHDTEVLKDIAKKAYKAACLFEEANVNEEFAKKYLDSRLELGALGPLFLATVSSNTDTFSRSHYNWLYELNKTKLKWDWKPYNKEVSLEEEQQCKLDELMRELNSIQQLAMSFEADDKN
jgi:hypothetical protein